MVRRLIDGLIHHEQLLFADSASSSVLQKLRSEYERWHQFPTEGEAERFSEIYALLKSDHICHDRSLRKSQANCVDSCLVLIGRFGLPLRSHCEAMGMRSR